MSSHIDLSETQVHNAILYLEDVCLISILL